jgi:hypothetical protein
MNEGVTVISIVITVISTVFDRRCPAPFSTKPPLLLARLRNLKEGRAKRIQGNEEDKQQRLHNRDANSMIMMMIPWRCRVRYPCIVRRAASEHVYLPPRLLPPPPPACIGLNRRR